MGINASMPLYLLIVSLCVADVITTTNTLTQYSPDVDHVIQFNDLLIYLI